MLKKVLGITVKEFHTLASDEKYSIYLHQGKYNGSLHCSLIELDSASAVGIYGQGDFFAGTPAVTKNEYGQGVAYYIATQLDENGMASVIDKVLLDKGISDLLIPECIEIVSRESEEVSFKFIINHSRQTMMFSNPFGKSINILNNEPINKDIKMNPFEVIIIQNNKMK